MNHQETTADAVKRCKDLIEAFVPDKQNNIFENEFNFIKNQIENLRMNCDECYDLAFYSRVMFQLYTGKINLLNAKQQINSWKISTNVDCVLKSLATTNSIQFGRTEFTTSNPLIYLDQNVISKCVNKSEIKNRILKIKNSGNFQFVYSPSHIEEVYKIEDTVKQSTFCDVITEITSNVSVQPESDENMMTYIESPSFPLNRIKQSEGSTQAVENIKLLHNDKRKLYFEKYNENEHQKRIGNEKEIFDSISDEDFAELMFFCGTCRQRKEKQSFKASPQESTFKMRFMLCITH